MTTSNVRMAGRKQGRMAGPSWLRYRELEYFVVESRQTGIRFLVSVPDPNQP